MIWNCLELNFPGPSFSEKKFVWLAVRVYRPSGCVEVRVDCRGTSI